MGMKPQGFGIINPIKPPEGELRVLVCGDRKWFDRTFVFDTLDLIRHRIDLLIEGGAPGADTWAHEWANQCLVSHLHLMAKWGAYGKAAGPIRNIRMLKEGKPNLVIAFHDNIKESKGTYDMLNQAARAKIYRILISHDSQLGEGSEFDQLRKDPAKAQSKAR